MRFAVRLDTPVAYRCSPCGAVTSLHTSDAAPPLPAWRPRSAQVEQSAAKRGIAPQALADENSAAFRTVMETLGISFDDFIRTTDDYHQRQVQALVSKCAARAPLPSPLPALAASLRPLPVSPHT